MSEQPHAPRRGVNIALLVIAAAALITFLILNGHGDHLLSLAPLFFLFTCPLMHLFMHRHRGVHGPRGAD